MLIRNLKVCVSIKCVRVLVGEGDDQYDQTIRLVPRTVIGVDQVTDTFRQKVKVTIKGPGTEIRDNDVTPILSETRTESLTTKRVSRRPVSQGRTTSQTRQV